MISHGSGTRLGHSEAMAAELSAAQAAKLQRWQTLVFVALFGGYFLYTAGRRGVTAAQDSLKSELGFTMSDIGTLNSAFTAAYGLSKFVGNIMTDFFSAKQLFVLGLAAAGVANLVMGVSSSLSVSAAVWSLNGALQGLGWPALSELVMRWFQPVRALHFPLSHSFSHTNLKSPCAEQAVRRESASTSCRTAWSPLRPVKTTVSSLLERVGA